MKTFADITAAITDLRQKVDSIFSGKANAEQAEAFRADLTALTDRVALSEKVNTELSADNKAKAEEIAALKAEAEDGKNKVAALEAKHAKELQDIQAGTDKQAAAKAAAIAAGQGIGGPVPIKSAGTAPASSEDIRAQFEAMKPGAERSAFYNKHRDTLR